MSNSISATTSPSSAPPYLYASYAEHLSTRDSRKCREIIQSRGVRSASRQGERGRTVLERIGYQGLLALLDDDPWHLNPDQNAKRRFENSRSGYRIATSVGGTATGEGGDVIVIDDPHKADEVESDVQRENVLAWHDSTMSTRLNDPKKSARVLIMQRLHERDLTGHLLAQGGWEHLCLPAEYEPSHPFVWPQDPRKRASQLLWNARVGVKELDEQKRALGSYGAAGQLQQRPAPAEGAILRRRWWRYYDPHGPMPHFNSLAQSWDMAYVDSDGADYVVGQLWGCFGARRYLLHQIRRKLEFTDTIEAVHELSDWAAQRYGNHRAHAIYIEDKANGPAIISQLRASVPGLIAVKPEGDKVARARSVAPLVEAGDVYLPGAPNADHSDCDRTVTQEWVQAVIEECATFPNSAHDDQVDALSQALRALRGAGTPVRQKSRGKTMTGGLLTKPL